MPAKPRRKGRRPQYKNKVRQQQAAAQPGQADVATPIAAATPITAKTAPVSKAAPVSTKATTAQYPFFTSELKKIGIIGGIIVVILIILAIILT